MYCPKCGKENPEGARFCMHCGSDFSGYKAEISPKIEVSPKISVSAKAEGVPYPKWKPKVEKHVKIKGENLPVYYRFAEFDGKPFCPQCGAYDSLEEVYISDTRHVNSRSVTIVEYNGYKCLACGKKALIFIDLKEYSIPSIAESGYLGMDDVGKLPVLCEKPEICPDCKIPNTIEYIKEAYFITRFKTHVENHLFGEDGYMGVIYGHKYDHYKCYNCDWHFLVKESSEERELNSVSRYSRMHSPVKSREVFKWEKDEIVRNLCEACGERPAVMEGGFKYTYRCEVCGKALCENCVQIGKGTISKHCYCPSCASSRMCEVCRKNVAVYTCSSCGRSICKDCAHGILRKKCPNCK